MSSINAIKAMLEKCAAGENIMPPTVLYNEGWMLRLVVQWFSEQNPSDHPLSFPEKSRWYSEALIPSAFLARKRGDKLAESWTHADGVIGHFEIGKDKHKKTALSLLPGATALKFLEAKMFSRLSSGITHARYYNQAARNIACIAEILHLAEVHKTQTSINTLAFYLIAPESQIERGFFSKDLSKENIRINVERRVNDHDSEHKTDKKEWFQNWFEPTLEKVDIQSISWENILAYVRNIDPDTGNDLGKFYDKCLQYNKIKYNDIIPEE